MAIAWKAATHVCAQRRKIPTLPPKSTSQAKYMEKKTKSIST